jgi:hypothetical protein
MELYPACHFVGPNLMLGRLNDKAGGNGETPNEGSYVPAHPALKGDQIIESSQFTVKVGGARKKWDPVSARSVIDQVHQARLPAQCAPAGLNGRLISPPFRSWLGRICEPLLLPSQLAPFRSRGPAPRGIQKHHKGQQTIRHKSFALEPRT